MAVHIRQSWCKLEKGQLMVQPFSSRLSIQTFHCVIRSLHYLRTTNRSCEQRLATRWLCHLEYLEVTTTTRSLPGHYQKKNQPLRATLLQDSNTSCIIWPIATLLFYLRTESLWIKTSYSISFRFFSEPLDSPFCHFQQTSSLHNVHSKCVPDYFIVYTQAHTSAIAPSFWKKGPTVLSISTMTS